jgi:hypothetical protein
VNYSYVTPKAKINTRGSEFILNAGEDETTLVLKSGTAKIQSIDSDESVECTPDVKYTISSSIESEDLDERADF